jgi:hypothetical protein
MTGNCTLLFICTLYVIHIANAGRSPAIMFDLSDPLEHLNQQQRNTCGNGVSST